ncbi:hypothetical protein B0G80_5077 [Paraburkholderia sp. BL6669N2]|nr:hypothetical protein [Paraburkholderia sp. BL6665CI2N2]REG48785.1 hypothetical protein B0G80_5077 [Paraburkholderia sp. BL6669N2]TDY23454.1 hypothetical protein B0G81_3818 [Paraburkholderia sp. BL6665CI2N2]
MDTTEYSLRSLIEKWFGPTPASPVRLTRFSNRTPPSRGRYACVEASRPAASLAIFFFRHEDGTWHVFPPEATRPAMSVSPQCTAVQESAGHPTPSKSGVRGVKNAR